MEKIYKNEIAQNSLSLQDIKEFAFDKKGKIFELKDNPNKLIRIEDPDDLIEKHNGLNIDTILSVSKHLFNELKDEYNIISPVEFDVIKNKNGQQAICSFVDKIEGKHFSKLEQTQEIKNKISSLYDSISKYFLDKYIKKESYIWDINGESQYLYGKKKEDSEDKIYLIDTDIWFSKNKNDIYLSFYWLCRHMGGLEKKFNIKFEKARNNIKEFITLPLPKNLEESNMKCFESIKKFLNDELPDYDPESAIPRFE